MNNSSYNLKDVILFFIKMKTMIFKYKKNKGIRENNAFKNNNCKTEQVSPRILITESIETKNKKPIKETVEGRKNFLSNILNKIKP